MDGRAPDPPMGLRRCPSCAALVERGWDRCRICGLALVETSSLGPPPADGPRAGGGLIAAVVAVFVLAGVVGWWALGRSDGDDGSGGGPTSTVPVREGGESRSEAAAALLVAELDARGIDAEERCVASIAVRPGHDAALTEALEQGTLGGGAGRDLLAAIADECVGRARFVVAMARHELGVGEPAAACLGDASTRDPALAGAFMGLPMPEPAADDLARMAPCLSADELARLSVGTG